MLFWVLGFVWVWFVDVKMSDEKVTLANFHVHVYVYFSEKNYVLNNVQMLGDVHMPFG